MAAKHICRKHGDDPILEEELQTNAAQDIQEESSEDSVWIYTSATSLEQDRLLFWKCALGVVPFRKNYVVRDRDKKAVMSAVLRYPTGRTAIQAYTDTRARCSKEAELLCDTIFLVESLNGSNPLVAPAVTLTPEQVALAFEKTFNACAQRQPQEIQEKWLQSLFRITVMFRNLYGALTTFVKNNSLDSHPYGIYSEMALGGVMDYSTYDPQDPAQVMRESMLYRAASRKRAVEMFVIDQLLSVRARLAGRYVTTDGTSGSDVLEKYYPERAAARARSVQKQKEQGQAPSQEIPQSKQAGMSPWQKAAQQFLIEHAEWSENKKAESKKAVTLDASDSAG